MLGTLVGNLITAEVKATAPDKRLQVSADLVDLLIADSLAGQVNHVAPLLSRKLECLRDD